MQFSLAVFLLGAARTVVAQECLVWASSTTTSSVADPAPTCGFRGWDTGTNIGFFVDTKYASYTPCKNLCRAYVGCLSFTYRTSDPAVCILYDHIVEGFNTADASSPYVFFNDGGLCPGVAALPGVAATTTTTSIAAAASTIAAASTLSSTTSSTTKPSTMVTSTTTSSRSSTTTPAAQLTTLYSTSTVCK